MISKKKMVVREVTMMKIMMMLLVIKKMVVREVNMMKIMMMLSVIKKW